MYDMSGVYVGFAWQPNYLGKIRFGHKRPKNDQKSPKIGFYNSSKILSLLFAAERFLIHTNWLFKEIFEPFLILIFS